MCCKFIKLFHKSINSFEMKKIWYVLKYSIFPIISINFFTGLQNNVMNSLGYLICVVSNKLSLSFFVFFKRHFDNKKGTCLFLLSSPFPYLLWSNLLKYVNCLINTTHTKFKEKYRII